MFALKYFLIKLCDIYSAAILVYVLMSWIPYKTGVIARIDDFLASICEPYLSLFRKLIPPLGGTVDVTPIIALLVLEMAVRLLVNLW